jgi:hypothetical protein
MYPLKPLSQEQTFTRLISSADALANWKSQLPLFLGSIPASSLRTGFRRQSIIIRLAHAHAIIHAKRPFLLGHYVDPNQPPGSGQGQHEGFVHDCIQAAKDVIDALESFEPDDILFRSYWFTQYVAFCAIAALYIYQIFQHQRSRRGSSPGETTEDVNSASQSWEKDYFSLSEQWQHRLAAVAIESSPGRKYALVLEELRQEIYRRPPISGLNLQSTAETTGTSNMMSEGPLSTGRDGSETSFMDDLEIDTTQLFGSWGISGWAQLDLFVCSHHLAHPSRHADICF